MIASQAVRTAQTRRAVRPRPRHTARVTPRRGGTTWEIRTFAATTVLIACVFVLAMLYLAQTTTVSTLGYQAQRLEQTRDELRRQNALLEVENARLDSPSRIQQEATKLGLVRAASIPVFQLDQITAKR